MKYDVKYIVSRVFDLLDENEEILEERVELADPGTHVAPLIAGLLPRIARDVLISIPADRIDECRRLVPADTGAGAIPGRMAPESQGSGDFEETTVTFGNVTEAGPRRAAMTLPADFLRLIYFRMDDWEEGVTDPLVYGSESHRLRYRCGSRGRFSRNSPAVAVRRAGSERKLLIYGTGPGSKMAELHYVAVPTVRDDMIDLPPGAVYDVCCRLAETVARIIGLR